MHAIWYSCRVTGLFRRPWVVALAVALVAGAAVLSVALARSRSGGCDVAELRSLGGYDQPIDPAQDPRSIADASVTAAAALHDDLAGATADTAVREAANGPAEYDALVVPLSVPAGATGQRRVVGVVSWLLDCSGRAWFDDVRDVLRTDPSLLPAHYPVVAAAGAAQRLGVATPLRLVWRTSPFTALWLDPQSGRTLPAGLP
jgi:hypothetical protein